jgi:hypothetical protein
MCSSCYKAHASQVSKTWKKHFSIAMIKLRAMRRFTIVSKKPIQKQKNRCWKCQKKIGISGIECRCGYTFCAAHRYANEHDCDFDHKARQSEKIKKENIEVKAKKMTKIGEQASQSHDTARHTALPPPPHTVVLTRRIPSARVGLSVGNAQDES